MEIQIINIGKTTQLMLCYKNYCSHFWIRLLLPSKIAKNYQKPPFWSYIQQQKKKQPQIITSISSQQQSEKWPDQKKYQLQNSATYRPPIKIKQINYQPEIFGPWALGPKGCTNQHHHHQQVAGNNNHEYPR